MYYYYTYIAAISRKKKRPPPEEKKCITSFEDIKYNMKKIDLLSDLLLKG